MSGTNPPLFPPSGIPRTYGVNFFIYNLPSYPPQMAATTTAQDPIVPWSFIVSPSAGLMNYFDSILGVAPAVQAGLDDCISEAFMADTTGTGGAQMFAG